MENKILGIGNALVDMIYHLPSDEALLDLQLPKGSMTLVDWQRAGKILSYFKNENPTLSSGGSASNTISAVASLGGGCGFIGCTGKTTRAANFIRRTSRSTASRRTSPTRTFPPARPLP